MADLADYREQITNSLHDTVAKYTNAILDEALRKVLNEYTRAFPNIHITEVTVAAAGRRQNIADCTNLIAIIKLLHPYNNALADPFSAEREDFMLTWTDGYPYLFFNGSDIPQVDEIIYIEYASKQLIDDLDSATSTTVRDDHQDLLVVGAAGLAAMMRASGLNEQWGARLGEMSALMLWGSKQYAQFQSFLMEIRTEQTINIFPETYWRLDEWDNH